MASSAQQVQELATQMQTLALEKQRLEAQNRVLQHTVKLSSRHIQDTAAEKVAGRLFPLQIEVKQRADKGQLPNILTTSEPVQKVIHGL